MRRPPVSPQAAPVAVRFVLVCHSCQDAWEPDLDHLDPAELAGAGCRRCGGWTWLGEITEPDTAEVGGGWS